MKAELSALAALSREERRILRQAWFAFLLVDLGLRFFSLPTVQRLLSLGLDIATGAAAEIMPPPSVDRLVDVAARHHLRPMRCLQRSLVLQALLSRQGLPSDLRIGVRRYSDRLDAHAWLEQSGRPLFETLEIRDGFTPLLRPGQTQ
jgi:hypothetical protein